MRRISLGEPSLSKTGRFSQLICDLSFGAAVLLDAAYGHKVAGDDDELVHMAEKAISATARAGRCVRGLS